MRIVVHEWCCSGGLAGPEAAVVGPAADAILPEARGMFRALLVDARRCPGLDVVALVDETRPLELPAGIDRRPVPPGAEIETLADAAAGADAVVVVAPETAGILGRRVAAVRAAGGRPLACDPAFIAVAADKQATALALAAAGVPVPAGRRLEPHAEWPADFIRPAICKRLDGVGGDGLRIVDRAGPTPPVFGRPSRIEAFAAGLPVGVALICTAGEARIVAVLEQVFAPGEPGSYRGGRSLADGRARERAADLARRAVGAVSRAAAAAAGGWVGVDMILGDREDGMADRVLEVNPRLTTAFVGLAPRAPASLVGAMLAPASRHCHDQASMGLDVSALDFRIDADA
jgi:predicted ATP-grasp superfamily ATP-dependent carboligase